MTYQAARLPLRFCVLHTFTHNPIRKTTKYFLMQEVILQIRRCDYIRLMALRPPPELRAELDRAIVTPDDSIPKDIVTMNARVCYRDEATGAERWVELAYPEAADPSAGRISVLAPVGAALLGLRVGQDIEWDFPNGAVRRLTVIAVIQPPPETATEPPATEPSH